MNMIDSLRKYYKGFYIDQPVGNNAFSFDKRTNKKIYVPSVIQGSLSDVNKGSEVVFSEFYDGFEINKTGLMNFVYWQFDGKDVFIFDNHNHAFFFWMVTWKFGKIHKGSTLVHIDQHKDMREPSEYVQLEKREHIDLLKVFEYTNSHLNVGNFIMPAIKTGLFSRVEFIDHKEAFESAPEEFVLDIDMYIFSSDMNYIDNDYKVQRIRRLIEKASIVTIATSPYFIDQDEAVSFIKQLF